MSEAVRLVIGGDLFPTPINYELFSKGESEKIFGTEVSKIFQRADFSICNLEGCFTGGNTAQKIKDGPKIRAPKETVAGIRALGVNCVSLANNHVTDYGNQGYLDTVAVLEEAGIGYFGAGIDRDSVTTQYTVTLRGKTVSFYGVSETIENVPTDKQAGVNIYDEYRVCNEIKELKAKSDYVIVLYHGGIENTHYNTESIRVRFHRMADSGADVVISQHTHAIGEEEHYNGAYLLYGQGNFCFHFAKNLRGYNETALLLEMLICDDGFSIEKHLVRRAGAGIVYDPQQDLSAFYERSERLMRNESFLKEFKELADEKLIVYLEAFRGKNLVDKCIRKFFPRHMYLAYMRGRYTKRHILKILLALQCEEFREVSAQGLLDLLEERNG